MSKEKQKPIYVVVHKPTGVKRLVQAHNESGARKHVVSETITVDRASQSDLVALVGAGTKLEVAVDES
jgi:hypothetical protein